MFDCFIKMLRGILLLLTLSTTTALQAQFHTWANPLTTSRSGSSFITAKAVDANGNIYLAGTFRDTLYFPNDTLFFSSGVQQTFFIAKYDGAGNHLWSQQFSKSANGIIKNIAINSRNQILLFGQYQGTSIDFGSISLTSGRGVFVAFMDTAGRFTAAREIATAGTTANAYNMVLGPDDAIHASIYLNGFSGGAAIQDSLSPVTTSSFQIALVKFSRNAQRLQWHHFYNALDFSDVGGLSVDKDRQVYFSLKGLNGKTLFGVSTGTAGTPSFLLWYRPNGNLHKTLNTMLTAHAAVFTGLHAVDSNTLYVSGSTNRDSLIFCGTSMRVQGRNRGPNRRFHFIFQLRFFDTIGWYATSIHQEGSDFRSNLAISGDFIYGSFLLSNDTFRMGGFFKRGATLIRCVIYKFDRLGNMLWFIDNPSPEPAIINTIPRDDLVYSGLFGASVFLDPFTLRGRSTANAFITRITDYNIVRGKVKSGPYCAGDSLKVPYTKSGVFDTSNVFIAELSDENGRFEGKESVLGRLKSNKDGTITGRLPLLRVPTSPLYRIRIRSTQPVVQSFFRLDTLRLLIYSRDKADPGRDTTICLGDTFQLNTFGGTRWTWSPSVRMSNRLARNPKVWPDTSTTYTIIIADSSGCGRPDTADIRVNVRNRPQILRNGLPRDSLVCMQTRVVIPARFQNGLPSGYRAEWRNARGGLLRKSALGVVRDTFSLRFDRDTLIVLSLSDGCHPRTDTVHIRLRNFASIAFGQKPSDTTLCLNNLYSTKARFTGGNGDSVRWRWVNTGNNNLLSQSDSLRFTVTGNRRIALNLEDRCTQKVLQHTFNVQVYQALSGSWNLSRSDTLCYGAIKTWSTQSGGGNPGRSRRYRWFVNGRLADRDSVFSLRTDTLHSGGNAMEKVRIRLESDDNCTTPAFVLEDSVFIRPPLRFAQKNRRDTLICLYRKLPLSAPANGGRNNTRSWLWQVNGNTAVSQRDFTFEPERFYTPSDTGNRFVLRAIVRDGCSIPDTLRFRVFTPDTLALQLPKDFTLCNGQQRLLQALGRGGLPANYSFSWRVNQSIAGNRDTFRFALPNAGNLDADYWVKVNLADACYGRVVADSLRVKVRRNLLLSLNSDTLNPLRFDSVTLCFGQGRMIQPRSAGGNNAAHRLRWKLNGQVVSDSLRFYFGQARYGSGANRSYRITATLSDGCSAGSDSLTQVIRLFDTLSVRSPADTLLCYGGRVDLRATGNGGRSATRQFSWSNGSQMLGSGNTYTNGPYYSDADVFLVLSDGCTRPNDTARVRIRVRPALALSGAADALCFETGTTLRLSPRGGIPAAYRYRWFENGQELTVNDSVLPIVPLRLSVYTAVLEDACSEASDTVRIAISSKPRFTTGPYNDTSCAPYKLILQPASSTADAYNFTAFAGSQNWPVGTARTFAAGQYRILLVASDALACADTQVLNLLVHPRPDAAFTWTPGVPDLDNPQVRFQPTEIRSGTQYAWSLDGTGFSSFQSPEYLFADTGFYRIRLRVRNVEGCADTSERTLRMEANYRLFLPNSFTPNGDGLNDFYIPYAKGIISMRFAIYNRWGQLLFEGDDKNGWDGRYRGQVVPEGVYVVTVSLKNRFGYRVFEKGEVSLLW
jgi:gliding motility-associated-like protein